MWIVDDDEFDHIVKNSQRVLRLNDQYENHPYAQEFTKRCNVIFLIWNIHFGGEDRCKTFFWWYVETIPRISFTKQCKQLLQAIHKLYEGMKLPKKTSDLPLSNNIIKQTRKTMMEVEKDVLWRNIDSHLYLQAIIFLHQRVILKDTWKTQFLGWNVVYFQSF